MGSASSNASSNPARPPPPPMNALCTSPSSSFPCGGYSSLSLPIDDELHADAGGGGAIAASTSTGIRRAWRGVGREVARRASRHAHAGSVVGGARGDGTGRATRPPEGGKKGLRGEWICFRGFFSSLVFGRKQLLRDGDA